MIDLSRITEKQFCDLMTKVEGMDAGTDKELLNQASASIDSMPDILGISTYAMCAMNCPHLKLGICIGLALAELAQTNETIAEIEQTLKGDLQ